MTKALTHGFWTRKSAVVKGLFGIRMLIRGRPMPYIAPGVTSAFPAENAWAVRLTRGVILPRTPWHSCHSDGLKWTGPWSGGPGEIINYILERHGKKLRLFYTRVIIDHRWRDF